MALSKQEKRSRWGRTFVRIFNWNAKFPSLISRVAVKKAEKLWVHTGVARKWWKASISTLTVNLLADNTNNSPSLSRETTRRRMLELRARESENFWLMNLLRANKCFTVVSTSPSKRFMLSFIDRLDARISRCTCSMLANYYFRRFPSRKTHCDKESFSAQSA